MIKPFLIFILMSQSMLPIKPPFSLKIQSIIFVCILCVCTLLGVCVCVCVCVGVYMYMYMFVPDVL